MDEADDRSVEVFDSGHTGFGEMGSEQNASNGGGVMGEVDTSAPFESVKEAVTRFGGIGFWKPHIHKPSHASEDDNGEVFDAAKVEEQAVQLANELMVKERETLEVLKELEATKTTVEELKVKLQKESAEVNATISNRFEEARKENKENTPVSNDQRHSAGDRLMCPPGPGFILMELKQAKLNLTRTTNDLADIRSTVETYNKKIEKERSALEKTRERLSSKPSKMATLEEEVDLPRELHRLASETEQFKKVGEMAKSEVLRATNQIKQTKMRMKTAEIRLMAARKLKEAARASEACAQLEMKSLSKSQTLPEGEGVTLSFEEYSSLKLKAREAKEASNRRVDKAMVQVDEAEISKTKILKRVEEATEEVKNSKRALEEALSRVEAANNDKLKSEGALRKWRSDHGQRRKSTIQNSTKFKNSSCHSNTRLLEVNGAHLGSNVSSPVLRPTMSIGQILSRKLLLTEEYSEKNSMRRKVSLAQMLSKPNNGRGGGGSGGDGGGGEKRYSAKRKKFGFGRISFIVAKPSKKKKKHSVSSQLSCVAD